MDRSELISAIKEAAYLEGDFVLRSGRRSKYYLDKYLFETQPEILAELGRLMAERVTDETDRIAGAELGGVPLAAATAMASGKPFVIIRNAKKDYGTAKQFEGKLESGERVLLVEDVVTTAGQIIEAAKSLQDAGAVIERVLAVIDRQEGGRENVEAAGLTFEALFTVSDLGVKASSK
ncbi:MAG: orotate phosphoribosyltransferase [Phycisphaerae bacterium]|nr:orotate phosphoribosyltransferase [Phycisphaerae bacterium]